MSELSAQSPVERATQCSGVGSAFAALSIACPLSAQLRSSTRHFALECVWRSEMRIMRNDHTINIRFNPAPAPSSGLGARLIRADTTAAATPRSHSTEHGSSVSSVDACRRRLSDVCSVSAAAAAFDREVRPDRNGNYSG